MGTNELLLEFFRDPGLFDSVCKFTLTELLFEYGFKLCTFIPFIGIA